MTSAQDKRSDLIEKLADHILADGLLNASLRPLAKAVGTSDRMLLYYFKDKDDLIEAVLDHIAARITVILEQSRAPEPLPLELLAPMLLESMKSDLFGPICASGWKWLRYRRVEIYFIEPAEKRSAAALWPGAPLSSLSQMKLSERKPPLSS